MVCGNGLEREEMACFVNSFTHDILETVQGKDRIVDASDRNA